MKRTKVEINVNEYESYNHSYTKDLKINVFFIGFYGNKSKALFQVEHRLQIVT